MKEIIRNELKEAQTVLSDFLTDENIEKIESAAKEFKNTISKGNKILSCGNGGSMCDSMHFAEELTGKFRDERNPLPAIAISDPSHITCVGNDYGFEYIFSRYIEGVGNKGDSLLAISTSGNSRNILNAAIKAKEKGVTNFSLIHDSFGCVAPDVHKLSEAIREAFCEVYEQDVLTNWAMEMKQMLSEKNAKKFPHIPERGNLDLSLVKQSTFFCV